MKNITKSTPANEIKLGDTYIELFESMGVFGKWLDMKVSEIKVTKKGMVRLKFSGTYVSNDGNSSQVINYPIGIYKPE